MSLRAVIAAALVTVPFLAPTLAVADANVVRYTSTVVAVNETTNSLVFADRTVGFVDKSIPVTRDLIGKTVEVTTTGDEDGNAPAKQVRVLN